MTSLWCSQWFLAKTKTWKLRCWCLWLLCTHCCWCSSSVDQSKLVVLSNSVVDAVANAGEHVEWASEIGVICKHQVAIATVIVTIIDAATAKDVVIPMEIDMIRNGSLFITVDTIMRRWVPFLYIQLSVLILRKKSRSTWHVRRLSFLHAQNQIHGLMPQAGNTDQDLSEHSGRRTENTWRTVHERASDQSHWVGECRHSSPIDVLHVTFADRYMIAQSESSTSLNFTLCITFARPAWRDKVPGSSCIRKRKREISLSIVTSRNSHWLCWIDRRLGSFIDRGGRT